MGKLIRDIAPAAVLIMGIAGVVACSADSEQSEQTDTASEPKNDSLELLPRDVATESSVYEHPSGDMQLGPGVEVAAAIELPNGNTAFFMLAGNSWGVGEAGHVGNLPLVDGLIAGLESPVDQFEVLAPGQEVPASIASLKLPARRVSGADHAEKLAAVERFEELKRQSESGELDQGVDGLDSHGGGCGSNWFDDNICVNYDNEWGRPPNITWFRDALSNFDEFDRNAWNGRAMACGDNGNVRLHVQAAGYDYSKKVYAGHYYRSAVWSHFVDHRICSGWSCETISVSTNTDADSWVDEAGGSDVYHWCGWYDTNQ